MRPSLPASLLVMTMAVSSCAQTPSHAQAGAIPAAAQVPGDGRQLVRLPDEMRDHTLASMRDHLQTLAEISAALSAGDYDTASVTAERRLGMTSLDAHGAAHLAPFMPQGMQEIGAQMHRAASRFAIEAQNAAASNDVRPSLAALAQVTQQCVACHAAYRLR